MALNKRFKKNLGKLGISRVELTCEFPAIESIAAAVNASGELAPGIISINTYSINKVRHLVRQMVQYNRDEETCFFEALYVAGERVPTSKPPREFEEEADILEILNKRGEAITFSFRIEIECGTTDSGPHGRADRPMLRTIFPLPTDVSPLGRSDGPIDQIRGIRGVKFESELQDEVEYQFILDRPLNDEISLSLIFDETGVPSNAIDEALNRADTIAADFGLPRDVRRLETAK